MQKVLLLLTLPFFLLNLVKDKHFIVLLQNNYEIRPSGGFMGSYADLKFEGTKLKTWEVQDIYVPDGQLDGHVDPPVPIQEAFQNGDYRLRDSNWKISFPDAAAEINWFFEKGGVKDIDGIIAVNLGLFEKILDIVGPVKPLDYSEEVNSKNFYSLAETYAEHEFFPGSTKKKSYLYSVGKVLLAKILEAGPVQKIQIANLIRTQLNERQIFIFMKDKNLEKKISTLGWDGSLGKYKVDYLYPVESNLGSNKVNYYIERSVTHKVNTGDDPFKIGVTINWENRNKEIWEYLNYERIVIPSKAIIKSIRVNSQEMKYDTESEGNFKTIGFWVKVPPSGKNSALLNYELPKSGKKYNFVYKTQPGLYNVPFSHIIEK